MFMSFFRQKVLKLIFVGPSYEIISCDLGKRRFIWRGRLLKKRANCAVSGIGKYYPVSIVHNLLIFLTVLPIKTYLIWKLWNNKYVTVKTSIVWNVNSARTSDIVQADVVCGENDFNTVLYYVLSWSIRSIWITRFKAA